ncbi:pimeloyl-ACP methyl ester carboxylesterase [Inquilinus ginsengisoli]|uniref:Pimeloyl-ACP methyl ester carboxylesterase n=1 Tax=Inquilinus ginsengisoli TaxID=363840 RepID=A0ABU1JQK5_9PROT|nr:alpha/beta hydrolase [Inquilinus ginsengisoli]MDR6290904.1 pimeloyl-ACP methyl ester carboxylesterase [Inquilinus ginsengisoli]
MQSWFGRPIALSFAAMLALAAPLAVAADGTVVLVHGAFADGSSWSKVIPLLEAKGLRVIAVQLPMTSLADDVAVTTRAIDRASGPVTLVGHSWGGTVITEAGTAEKVRSLVYVAAFANDSGESDQDLLKGYPDAPGGAAIQVDPSGFAHLSDDGVTKDFAPDLPASERRLIAATQGPIRAANFGEKTTAAAWATKPSWFVVAADDRMIPPALEEAMARKIKASMTTLKSSHVAMLAQPEAVAKVIEAAAGFR